MGQSREEIENLTHGEVVEVLTMADMEEQDRQHFMLATKTTDPLKTYAEIRQAVSEGMTPKPDMSKIPNIEWLRRT